MAKIYMVRHGQAAAGFAEHRDPGLDALGWEQAETAAQQLAPAGPLPIVSSPLARAQETAQPLAKLWQQSVAIEPRIAEIPSPSEDLAERSAWLRTAMAGTWQALSTDLQNWRMAVAQALLDVEQDTVMFSHFVALNAAVSVARQDDRMMIFAPDNGSITTFNNARGVLRVEALGETAFTHVN